MNPRVPSKAWWEVDGYASNLSRTWGYSEGKLALSSTELYSCIRGVLLGVGVFRMFKGRGTSLGSA